MVMRMKGMKKRVRLCGGGGSGGRKHRRNPGNQEKKEMGL